MRFFVSLVGMMVAVTLPTRANCGLDRCPRLSHEEKHFSNSVALQFQNVAFNLDSGSGYYDELLARYEYTGVHGWVFGGSLPVIALTTGGETHFGISNPLLYASWYGHLNKAGMIYLGTQLELPFGNAHDGIATDHIMLVPYLQVEQSFGAGYALASIGYSQAFTLHEHEGGEEHVLFVSPHEDQEFLYRIGTGFQIWNGKVSPQLSLSGRHAIVGELEGDGRDHIAGEIAVACALSRNWTLSPSIGLPMKSPKRFDWSAGVEIKSLF